MVVNFSSSISHIIDEGYDVVDDKPMRQVGYFIFLIFFVAITFHPVCGFFVVLSIDMAEAILLFLLKRGRFHYYFLLLLPRRFQDELLATLSSISLP